MEKFLKGVGIFLRIGGGGGGGGGYSSLPCEVGNKHKKPEVYQSLSPWNQSISWEDKVWAPITLLMTNIFYGYGF